MGFRNSDAFHYGKEKENYVYISGFKMMYFVFLIVACSFLVGWLKPWMLPEILSLSIPQRLQNENAVEGTSQQFINEFNEKHKHISRIPKENPSSDAQH